MHAPDEHVPAYNTHASTRPTHQPAGASRVPDRSVERDDLQVGVSGTRSVPPP